MIVLDENLDNRWLINAIATWYPGQVVALPTLRPATLVKDEAISSLLQKVNHPTFITINDNDFWKITRPHHKFCLVAFAMPKECIFEIPEMLRTFFRLPEFRTKAQRMGKIVRIRPQRAEYYGMDRQIHEISW